MTDVVRIELGGSIFQAELIHQKAVSEGLRVELLRNEHPETGGSFALGQCALLVHADDEPTVREILDDFGFGSDPG